MSDLPNAEDDLPQAPGISNRSPSPTELLQFVPAEKRAEFLRAVAAYRLEVERVEQYSRMASSGKSIVDSRIKTPPSCTIAISVT
ncbi:MAG: hypothetical protein OXG85_12030 [Chloroflexi bacterium]|nr:hypothetical protein [Chloroflexota bacterium]